MVNTGPKAAQKPIKPRPETAIAESDRGLWARIHRFLGVLRPLATVAALRSNVNRRGGQSVCNLAWARKV